MPITIVSLLITLGSTPLFNITAGTAPILLVDLECVGNELLLIDCPRSVFRLHCDHSRDVGVRCIATSAGPGVWLCIYIYIYIYIN